jgi:hypothetical protein
MALAIFLPLTFQARLRNLRKKQPFLFPVENIHIGINVHSA